MFDLLLFNLRNQGLKIGLSEWMAFLDGLRQGLVVDLEGLYGFGRAVLCHSEAHFDAWDLSFQATFSGVELPPKFAEALAAWLKASGPPPEGERAHNEMTPEQLYEEFLKRLKEQKERHEGGNYWIGTGGRSPFGNSGRADSGLKVGETSGGGRSAVRIAEERRWAGYRTDTTLEMRDFQAALKELRALAREGPQALHLDKTVRRTADNAGEIDLIFEQTRKNRVHLVLVMDTGGSMDPHTRLVEKLFAAAKAGKGFKSFKAWYFHNTPTGWLYRDYASWDRVRIEEAIADWTPQHRLVFVGDASMASWELFGAAPRVYGDTTARSGLDWLHLIRARCPASVWLNPDAPQYWQHPTVSAIGATFPMYPLTLAGLRDAVRALRAPQGAPITAMARAS